MAYPKKLLADDETIVYELRAALARAHHAGRSSSCVTLGVGVYSSPS